METTEATFNTGILNDILSGKPEKQVKESNILSFFHFQFYLFYYFLKLPALQKVITLAKNGKEIKPHWLKIINVILISFILTLLSSLLLLLILLI